MSERTNQRTDGRTYKTTTQRSNGRGFVQNILAPHFNSIDSCSVVVVVALLCLVWLGIVVVGRAAASVAVSV